MPLKSDIDRHDTDILILGTGGAGMFAALHAQQSAPAGTKITIAVKGLIGKCGCTRMVQGGYNVAMGGGDTVERHFMDTKIGLTPFQGYYPLNEGIRHGRCDRTRMEQ